MAIDPDAFNDFEARGWEGAAEGYDEFFGSVTGRIAEPLLDSADVTTGTQVLDLATGPGYVAGLAAARGAVPTGVDIADAMVALAKQRHPELEFVRGDVTNLPFSAETFDAVVGNFVVLHLGRPEELPREAWRVLRQEGRIALSAWDYPERARLFGVFVDAVAEVGAQPPDDVPVGPSFFRFSDEGEFASLLRYAGFDDVAVETIEFPHTVASSEGLWSGLLRGTVRTRALVLGQTEAVRGRIREAFERLVRPFALADGRLELPVSVKLASGRKP